jgi:deoxyuridine 5'-triphosphate nucleotidohydrolase
MSNGKGVIKTKVKLDEGAKMPTRAHPEDAGLDLYARETQTIRNSAVFDTGVHLAIHRGFFGKIESKSGLNVNYGVVSCGGVIDSGYTGSIKVKLYNLGNEDYTVKKGDKIAQLIIQPCVAPELEEVEDLDDTPRGDKGFGSTGR